MVSPALILQEKNVSGQWCMFIRMQRHWKVIRNCDCTSPLTQDLPRTGLVDGYLVLQRDEKPLCLPLACPGSCVAKPLLGAVLLTHKIPRSRLVLHAVPAPLGSQRHWGTTETSPPPRRVTPCCAPSPRQASGCGEQQQLAKTASSARLAAKE